MKDRSSSTALLVIDAPGPQSDDPGKRERRSEGNARTAEVLAARGSGLLNRALLGLVVVALLAIGFGGWSSTVELTGAVVAPGQLVVDTNVKRIQHAEGGIVGEILVKNGDRVAAGQVLIRMDDTQVRAARGVIDGRLLQLRAERTRLQAERDRLGALPHDEGAATADPRLRTALSGEEGLFEARRRLNDSQKARLLQRIDQVRKEMRAIQAQIDAKAREIDLIRKERQVVQDLHRRQLSNMTRLYDIQRQLARHEGDHAALESQHVRAESQITEIELQIIELEQRTTTEAYRDIREVEARMQELSERLLAADDRVRRTEIRAPVSGIVHDLSVHGVNAVLRAGETALLIVPDQDAMTVEVRVAATDIDQVRIGQRAVLRMTALNQRTTPQIFGEVSHVGADLSREPQSTRMFYLARVALEPDSLARLHDVKLVPGMPVECFIETGARTPLSYLVKPITDNFARAMREP